MRNAVLMLSGILFVLSSGCGVSESDYHRVLSERDAIEVKLLRAEEETASLREEILVLQYKNKLLSNEIERLKLALHGYQDESQSKHISDENGSRNNERSYVVKNGDTLWSISRQTGVALDTLRKLNDIEGSHLDTGQELIIR